jgi:hypothetical protein
MLDQFHIKCTFPLKDLLLAYIGLASDESGLPVVSLPMIFSEFQVINMI